MVLALDPKQSLFSLTWSRKTQGGWLETYQGDMLTLVIGLVWVGCVCDCEC